MNRICRALAVGWLLGIVLVAGDPAWAQEPDAEVIPRELAQALLGAGSPSNILVGELPQPIRGAVVLPAGSRIVGGLVSTSHSVGIVAVPTEPPEVREEVSRGLLQQGWTRFEPYQRGGFEFGPITGLHQFCLEDQAAVSLRITQAPGGGSYLRVTHQGDQARSVCSQPSPVERRALQSPIPSLAPPPGAVGRGSGSGGGGDEWHARARVRTDLGADELLDHYSEQLRNHGWTPLTRTLGSGTAVETHRMVDEDGVEWFGVLLVAEQSSGAEQLLTLIVTHADHPPEDMP